MKTCRHKWEPVDSFREEEIVEMHGPVIKYLDSWRITFICQKCKKIKFESDYKE